MVTAPQSQAVGWFLLLAGGMVFAGSVLPWVTFPVIERTAFDWDWGDTPTGPLLIAASIGLLAAGIVVLLVPGQRLLGIALGVTAGGLGLFMAGTALIEILDRVQVPVEYMFNVAEYNALFNSLGGGQVAAGPYLAVAGAFLGLTVAVVAGVMLQQAESQVTPAIAGAVAIGVAVLGFTMFLGLGALNDLDTPRSANDLDTPASAEAPRHSQGAPVAEDDFKILAPDDGSVVHQGDIEVSGIAPVGGEVVWERKFYPDNSTQVDGTGHWSILVINLYEGENDLVFRFGGTSTRRHLTVTYRP